MEKNHTKRLMLLLFYNKFETYFKYVIGFIYITPRQISLFDFKCISGKDCLNQDLVTDDSSEYPRKIFSKY